MDANAVTKAQTELDTGGKAATALLDALAGKLKTAADAGPERARGWQLDLREVSLSVREETSLARSLVGVASLGNPEAAAASMGSLADRAAQTEVLLTRLTDKVKASADLGDLTAREWHLDLREAAFAVREQSSVATSLANAAAAPEPVFGTGRAPSPYAQQPYPASPYAQPSAPYGQPYAQPPAAAYYAPAGGRDPRPTNGGYPQSQPQQGGGFFGRLMGSGFGQAMAMGAGFAVGEEVVDGIIDDIF